MDALKGILERGCGGEDGIANEGGLVSEVAVGGDAGEMSLLSNLIHGGFLDALGEEEG